MDDEQRVKEEIAWNAGLVAVPVASHHQFRHLFLACRMENQQAYAVFSLQKIIAVSSLAGLNARRSVVFCSPLKKCAVIPDMKLWLA